MALCWRSSWVTFLTIKVFSAEALLSLKLTERKSTIWKISKSFMLKLLKIQLNKAIESKMPPYCKTKCFNNLLWRHLWTKNTTTWLSMSPMPNCPTICLRLCRCKTATLRNSFKVWLNRCLLKKKQQASCLTRLLPTLWCKTYTKSCLTPQLSASQTKTWRVWKLHGLTTKTMPPSN